MVDQVISDAAGFDTLLGAQGNAGGNDPQREELIQKLFAHFDTNGNGRLDPQELPPLIHELQVSLGIEMDEGQADLLFGMLDADDEGTIDLEEFKVLFFQQQEGTEGDGLGVEDEIPPL